MTEAKRKLTSEFVDAWREATWKERAEMVFVGAKLSPLLVFGLWIRAGMYLFGEVDSFVPEHDGVPGGEVESECLSCGCKFTVARGRLLDERQLDFCRWCRHDLCSPRTPQSGRPWRCSVSEGAAFDRDD